MTVCSNYHTSREYHDSYIYIYIGKIRNNFECYWPGKHSKMNGKLSGTKYTVTSKIYADRSINAGTQYQINQIGVHCAVDRF